MISTMQMLPLTPYLFRKHVRPLLRADYQRLSLPAYQQRHPNVTHISFARDYRGKRIMMGVGKPAKITVLAAIHGTEEQ